MWGGGLWISVHEDNNNIVERIDQNLRCPHPSTESRHIEKIQINGQEKHSVVNTNGKTFDVTTLYLSNRWDASINDVGEIYDLTVISGKFFHTAR